MSPEWAFCHSIVSEMPQEDSLPARNLKAFRHADYQNQCRRRRHTVMGQISADLCGGA
jgi:hypothetical protein